MWVGSYHGDGHLIACVCACMQHIIITAKSIIHKKTTLWIRVNASQFLKSKNS